MGVGVITIRDMVVDDVDRAMALEAANQPNPWTERLFREELAAEGRTYLVAADDDELVGFGGVMIVGAEAHITNLLVDPARRGEGLGRRLIIELMRRAVGQGAKHLTLEVRTGNESARRLYESLGLAPVGIRPGYYDDDDALVMWAHDIDRSGFLEGLG